MIRATLQLLCLLSMLSHSWAQTSWSGYLDGVHPVLLSINDDAITGALTLSSRAAEAYEIVGSCNNDICNFRAREAALGIQFNRSDSLTSQLTLTDGQGLVQSGRLSIASDNNIAASLPASERIAGEVISYRAADGQLDLVLAHLANQGYRGTLYVASLGTSFSVSGIRANQLDLRDDVGQLMGTLSADFANNSDEPTAALSLGGTMSSYTLTRIQSVPLMSKSKAGRYDMLYPQPSNTNPAYTKQITNWWQDVTSAKEAGASMWFVPTRLDERLLSGWLVLEGTAFAKTTALNVDLKSGKLLKAAALLGPRKSRGTVTKQARNHTATTHPLQGEGDFVDWAKSVDFNQTVARADGLVFGGPYHQLYGPLNYAVSWADLGYTKKLPTWIAGPYSSQDN